MYKRQVYNDDVFAPFTAKPNAAENQLWVEHGKPMLFAGGTKGIHLDRHALVLVVVDVVDGKWEEAGVIVHDETNRGIAQMLVDMNLEQGLPIALGVIFQSPAPTFESAIVEQAAAAAKGKVPDLQALISKGQTWTVDA